MAVFARYALTEKGKRLIAKMQVNKSGIELSGFVTGSGKWSEDENLEYAKELKEPRQKFGFSDMSIPEGNPSTVSLTVNISNEGVRQLYVLREAGIMARDPEEGEILYAMLAAESDATYVPAYNGVGYSNIVQRFNLEVTNSNKTTINMNGAYVSASEYMTFRKSVLQIIAGLSGGGEGQFLRKKTGQESDYAWEDTPVVSRPRAKFPETGMVDAIYVDTDKAEIYVWKPLSSGANGYFKLPLGSEASETLQAQITENQKGISELIERIDKLEKRFEDAPLIVLKGNWLESEEEGVRVFTQEIAVAGMTEQKDAEVWESVIATSAVGIIAEKRAAALFFGKGIAEGMNGKIKLTCYERRPEVDFGIKIQGVNV